MGKFWRDDPMAMFGSARQWSVRQLLAAIAVAILALAVMPGCTWLFGTWRMPAPGIPTVEPGGGRGGSTIVYPAKPPTISDAPSQFVQPSTGYRSLGGAFIYDGGLLIVKAKGGTDAPLSERDLDVGLAFGREVAAHNIDRLDPTALANCIGDGDRPETAIQVLNLANRIDEVRAGIACARMRNPGAQWIGSSLMANDRRAVSYVLLERHNGERIGLFTDVMGFVPAVAGGPLRP
ncbi:MAG TPA: hypothetical protein VMT54_01230 [Candidatus Cybelea sp.]|nr:hypothetical protein [Candidatus Cybelea sp.]